MAFKLFDAKNDGRGLLAGFCGVFAITAATCLMMASLAFKVDPSTHISASFALCALFGPPLLTAISVAVCRSVLLSSLLLGAAFALICHLCDFFIPGYKMAAVEVVAGWACVEVFQNLARQFNRAKPA